ncbi:hypothetical protein D0T49_10140 [Paludibacter sp. 221]|uniref:hypothetical protein n=1 Tax=Paludibacter sp. 221 TaxID=2302939 RepID=UPI0013D7264A|nr:hypothetical protein [Paludibacter sp. 221]NDV47405.1 hypothetical protein [Paludibacter sp. 221]
MNRKQFLQQALVLFCIFQFSFFIFSATAQVTIGGEAEPAKGATLDLSPLGGYVGGLKLPNVSLNNLTSMPTAFTDKSAITDLSKLKGLQVYNTNTTIGEGVYTWNGNAWVKPGLSSGRVGVATRAALAAEVSIDANSSSDVATVNILVPGVYLVQCRVQMTRTISGAFTWWYSILNSDGKGLGAATLGDYSSSDSSSFYRDVTLCVFPAAGNYTISFGNPGHSIVLGTGTYWVCTLITEL